MKKLFLVLAGSFMFTAPAMAHDRHYYHDHVVEYHGHYLGHHPVWLPNHNHCHRHKARRYSHCHRHTHAGPGLGHHGRKKMHDAYYRNHINLDFHIH